MIIYFVRHGEAEKKAESDYVRNLTEKGKKDIEISINQCREKITRLDKVFSSPLVRARQTADTVLSSLALHGKKEIGIVDWLKPESNPAAAFNMLKNIDGTGRYMLVGHQPFASSFVDYCLGDIRTPSSIGTANIVAIDLECLRPGSGKLLWHITPS